ncbi:unnamed protein product [Linum tenue]|uniref:Uncharacterized protein n=1 Tax=Linum tenue TaxID=586396 RepID=A0AAV0KXB7_9ROSI|nr:unnamed protein product [Linum tenue]
MESRSTANSSQHC